MRHSAFGNNIMMFTSTIKAVVAWKHDPTAHNVAFKAAWSKGIPDPTALEQLAIIYEEQQRISALRHIHASQRCNFQNTKQRLPLLFLFGWAVWRHICPFIFWTTGPVQPTHTVQTDKLVPTHSYRQFSISSSPDLRDLDCWRKPEQPEETHADTEHQILTRKNNTCKFSGNSFQHCPVLASGSQRTQHRHQ